MKKAGRPAWQPTDDQRKMAEQLAAVGITHQQIAAVLGISHDTLTRKMGAELEIARAKANASVAKSLYQSAMDGVVPSMIFWLKCRAGWREQQPTESADTQTAIVFNRGELPDRLKTIEDKSGTSGND